MTFFVTLSSVFTLRKIDGDCLFGHIFALLSLKNGTNNSLNLSVSYTDFGSDDRVVRASASGAVDLVLIPSPVKPITLKLVIAASCLTFSMKGTA